MTSFSSVTSEALWDKAVKALSALEPNVLRAVSLDMHVWFKRAVQDPRTMPLEVRPFFRLVRTEEEWDYLRYHVARQRRKLVRRAKRKAETEAQAYQLAADAKFAAQRKAYMREYMRTYRKRKAAEKRLAGTRTENS